MGRARDVIEAREAWLASKRALARAMPWTAEWLRLRVDEHERARDYLRLDLGARASEAHPGWADDSDRLTEDIVAAALDAPEAFAIDVDADLTEADLLLAVANAQTLH